MKQYGYSLFAVLIMFLASNANADQCGDLSNGSSVCTQFDYPERLDSIRPGTRGAIYFSDYSAPGEQAFLNVTLKGVRLIGRTQVPVDAVETIPGCRPTPPKKAEHPNEIVRTCTTNVQKLVPAEIREYVFTLDRDYFRNTGILVGSQVKVTAVLPVTGQPINGWIQKVTAKNGNLVLSAPASTQADVTYHSIKGKSAVKLAQILTKSGADAMATRVTGEAVYTVRSVACTLKVSAPAAAFLPNCVLTLFNAGGDKEIRLPQELFKEFVTILEQSGVQPELRGGQVMLTAEMITCNVHPSFGYRCAIR